VQHLLEEPNEMPAPSGRQRAVMVGVAVTVTMFLGTLAYVLGSLAFEYRFRTMHEGRLAGLLAKHPSLELVDRAFENEGTLLLAAPSSQAAREKAVSRWGKGAEVELQSKLRGSPKMRVYQAGKGMVYFVFFGGDDILRDFVCVRQP
jgi:hypothetical protein